MHVGEVTYERLVNTGDFSHLKASAKVMLNEGDSVNEGIAKAKETVAKMLGYPEQAEQTWRLDISWLELYQW